MVVPKQALQDDTIWLGDELFRRADGLIEFNAGELQEISALAVDLRDNDVRQMPESLGSRYPALQRRMLGLRESLETGSGATLVSGLPEEILTGPETASRVFLGLSCLLGTPVSQSAAGELVVHVRDAGYRDDDPRSRGPYTRKRLSFHTDRCDVIGFLCLRRAQSGGENLVVHSKAVFNHILENRPDLLEVLCRPFLYQRHSVDPGNQNAFCQQPIFSFTQGHFACSFLRVLIDRAHQAAEAASLTALQIEALDYLEATCEDERYHVRFFQERGQMLFLNNWVTLHRRTEFVDHDAAELKRHLLRAWIAVPNSRPIDPLFAANFGDTSAGAVRGGMRPTGSNS